MCDYPTREAAMVVLRRDDTGKPTVWCDKGRTLLGVLDRMALSDYETHPVLHREDT